MHISFQLCNRRYRVSSLKKTMVGNCGPFYLFNSLLRPPSLLPGVSMVVTEVTRTMPAERARAKAGTLCLFEKSFQYGWRMVFDVEPVGAGEINSNCVIKHPVSHIMYSTENTFKLFFWAGDFIILSV